jgi:hypothetical protein
MSEALAPATQGWQRLRSRPLRLAHCDIHCKNMILDQGHVVFLDGELALWGDPVYDGARPSPRRGHPKQQGQRDNHRHGLGESPVPG